MVQIILGTVDQYILSIRSKTEVSPFSITVIIGNTGKTVTSFHRAPILLQP